MTRTALYRHFDKDGVLLYVGITSYLFVRNAQHRVTSEWHSAVHRTVADWFDDRRTARKHESIAIRTECPKYNIQHALHQPAQIGSESYTNGTAASLLADEIDVVADILAIATTTLGRRVGQGSQFYSRLREGKRVWPETVEKVQSRMKAILADEGFIPELTA